MKSTTLLRPCCVSHQGQTVRAQRLARIQPHTVVHEDLVLNRRAREHEQRPLHRFDPVCESVRVRSCFEGSAIPT